jgi:tetratricopeptide (TPR) repeat protein
MNDDTAPWRAPLERGDWAGAGKWLADPSTYWEVDEADEADIIERCLVAVRDGVGGPWPRFILCALGLDGTSRLDDRFDFEQVARWAREAIELDPDRPEGYRFAGSALYWLGEYPDALRYYEQLQARKPSSVIAYRIELMRAGGLSEPGAATILDRWAPDFSGDEADDYNNLGLALRDWARAHPDHPRAAEADRIAQAAYERALQLFDWSMQTGQGPAGNRVAATQARTCNNLAILYFDRQDFDRALAVAERGLEYADFNALQYTRYLALDRLGRDTDAAHAALDILGEYPMDVHDFVSIANSALIALLRAGDYEPAVAIANIALEAFEEIAGDPDYDEDFDDDDDTRARALQVSTNAILAYDFAGKVDTDTSIRWGAVMVHFVDAPPVGHADAADDPTGLLGRAAALAATGDDEAAIAAWSEAIDVAAARGDRDALRSGLTKRGYHLLYRFDDTGAAFADFTRIEAEGLADFNCYYYLGDCFGRLGQPEQVLRVTGLAEQQLLGSEKAVDAMTMQQLYMMRGDAAYDCERFDLAVEAYERSLRYQPHQGVEQNLKLARKELKKRRR